MELEVRYKEKGGGKRELQRNQKHIALGHPLCSRHASMGGGRREGDDVHNSRISGKRRKRRKGEPSAEKRRLVAVDFSL